VPSTFPEFQSGRDQLSPETGSRPGQPRAHRPYREAQGRGDLRVFEAVDLPEHEHAPLVGGEGPQGTFEGTAEGVALQS
jgi:hypothetical protein